MRKRRMGEGEKMRKSEGDCRYKYPEGVKSEYPQVRRDSLSRFLSGTQPGVRTGNKIKVHLEMLIENI